MDGQGTKWRRNTAEDFNRLSRVHERYRLQTTDRQQTDGRQHIANVRQKGFALCYRTVVYHLSCLSATLVYCGQTVGWIKMLLGTEVGPTQATLC